MSDTVKLIIEMPKDYYEIIKHEVDHHISDYRLFVIIANGTPLDSNDSDYAEVQAYFDGESFGWDEGRKALIEELKAEIQEKSVWYRGETYDGLCMALQILDRIGKESEDT